MTIKESTTGCNSTSNNLNKKAAYLATFLSIAIYHIFLHNVKYFIHFLKIGLSGCID